MHFGSLVLLRRILFAGFWLCGEQGGYQCSWEVLYLHFMHPVLTFGLNALTGFCVWTRCLVGIFVGLLW